jgi:outer membrane receptor for ferrienterochelin and colicin
MLLNKFIAHLVLLSVFLLSAFTASAQEASVQGIVTDADNNEPIPFANVIVEGTQNGSTTDFDGKFTITGIEPGYINLQVTYVGYAPKTSEAILVSKSTVAFIEIKLNASEVMLQEVQVTTDYFQKQEEAPLSMQSIGTKEIEGNPGSNRDISRVIQSFPGVGSTPAFRNDIIIRGGGPSENRFFLDDVEIPVINHFATQGASGGPVGIINADFIETVDFYSGSFPSDKYNALSGMFDFKQKEGNKDKTAFQVAIGASEAAFTMNGPIGDKTSYILSIRRSYLQFLFAALELPFLPTFNDYQLKVKTNFNTKNQLTIISIGSLDNLVLNDGIEDPDESQEYVLNQIPVNNQWSYTLGAVYKNFFDKGFHTFVLSRNMLNNSFYKYPENDETQNKILDYISTEAENKFRYELTLRDKGFKYNTSANLEYAKYTNQTAQQFYISDSLIDLNYQSDLGIFKYGLAGQVSKEVLKSRLLISLGLRFDGMNYNTSMANLFNQFSPRLSLSYNLTEKFLVSASAGRYFQQPAYTTLGFRNNAGELVNEENAKYLGNNQYNLGVEYRVSKSILLSLEGFIKDYFNYPIDVFTGASLANQGADYSSVVGATEASFTGTGKANGIEFLTRINLPKFSLLAAYTYVRSEFTDINNTLIPSSWDSKNLFSLTASKEFKNSWKAGLKWRFVGGLPYTPFDLETSANVNAWNAKGGPYLDYSQLNAERFNSFNQLDIRVDKYFFYDKWTLMLYLDIQNLLNFQAEGQDYVVRETNEDGTYKTINNGTEYVLDLIPNTSGTILPTIGIMVKF